MDAASRDGSHQVGSHDLHALAWYLMEDRHQVLADAGQGTP